MEIMLVIVASLIFLFIGKYVEHKGFRPLIAFLIGWASASLIGILILLLPAGSIDNWSTTGLALLFGVFPVFMGTILAMGAYAR
jgi:hypothetical protein